MNSARVEYSPEFDRRLDLFYRYIRDELKSPVQLHVISIAYWTRVPC